MAWSIFQQPAIGGQPAAVAWAENLLSQGGYPVSPGNVQFVYDWQLSEGGGGAYNPLNQGPVPGHPELTTTGSQYGGGAADYASYQAGILGALDYLNMPAYSGVKAGLMVSNPGAARSALIASPWASSHYGGGSAFATQPVPGQAQLLAGSNLGGPGGITFPSLPSLGGGGTGILSGLKSYLIDAVLIIFGLVAILVGLVVIAHGSGESGGDIYKTVTGTAPPSLKRTEPEPEEEPRSGRDDRGDAGGPLPFARPRLRSAVEAAAE